MLLLFPTFIYQYRISHWTIRIWHRRIKVCFIALLWDIILCQRFVCEFWGFHRGDFNPCKSYSSMGISKCCYFKCWDSQMLKNMHYFYHTFKQHIIILMDGLHVPFHLSLSSRIVYSSQSTYQTFLIVISVHKCKHIFLFTDLNLPATEDKNLLNVKNDWYHLWQKSHVKLLGLSANHHSSATLKSEFHKNYFVDTPTTGTHLHLSRQAEAKTVNTDYTWRNYKYILI